MKIIPALLLLALALQSTCIFLPLVARRPRCMMVYTIGEVESVKFDVVLPQLPSQGSEESYLLTLRNTETEESKMETVNYGQYKKEHDLTPSTSNITKTSSTSSASSSTPAAPSTTSAPPTTPKPSSTSTTPT